jgi:hypothetical protein
MLEQKLIVLHPYLSLPSTVGVVGSGKGMTNYEQKKRAKFEETGED